MTGAADNEPGPLRCVVVEDQRMFLQLLVGMLRSLSGLEVVATAATAASGIAACQAWRPDLLILDISLPDGSGIDVAEALAAVNPGARLIVLSAGASSFVCEAALQPMLHAVVDKIDACETLATEINELLGERHRAPAPLSSREQEVLQLIGLGHTNLEIATQLQISVHTVGTHRRNIAAKLGLRGGELVRHAALQTIQGYQDSP